jgi:hypothetical protein
MAPQVITANVLSLSAPATCVGGPADPCFPTALADVARLPGTQDHAVPSDWTALGRHGSCDKDEEQTDSIRSAAHSDRVTIAPCQTLHPGGDGGVRTSPLPVVHTHTYNFELVSQSGTPNYTLHVAGALAAVRAGRARAGPGSTDQHLPVR